MNILFKTELGDSCCMLLFHNYLIFSARHCAGEKETDSPSITSYLGELVPGPSWDRKVATFLPECAVGKGEGEEKQTREGHGLLIWTVIIRQSKESSIPSSGSSRGEWAEA